MAGSKVAVSSEKGGTNKDTSSHPIGKNLNKQSSNPSLNKILTIQRTAVNFAVQNLLKSQGIQVKL